MSVQLTRFSNLLLVDDDDISLMLSRMVISEMNLAQKIEVARNGREALSLIRNGFLNDTEEDDAGNIILMDINMPIMDGFEALYEITTSNLRNSNTKIYLLSNSLNPRDEEKSKFFPVEGILQKPLTREILEMVL